jgi:hypothetical protein
VDQNRQQPTQKKHLLPAEKVRVERLLFMYIRRTRRPMRMEKGNYTLTFLKIYARMIPNDRLLPVQYEGASAVPLFSLLRKQKPKQSAGNVCWCAITCMRTPY